MNLAKIRDITRAMVLMARRITITLRGYHPTRIIVCPQTRVAVGNSRTDHRDNRFTRALGCDCGTAGIIGVLLGAGIGEVSCCLLL